MPQWFMTYWLRKIIALEELESMRGCLVAATIKHDTTNSKMAQ